MGLVGVWTGFLDGVDFVHDTLGKWEKEGCSYNACNGMIFLLTKKEELLQKALRSVTIYISLHLNMHLELHTAIMCSAQQALSNLGRLGTNASDMSDTVA